MSVGPPNSIDRQDRHHGQGCETDRHCKFHCRRHKRKSVARGSYLRRSKVSSGFRNLCKRCPLAPACFLLGKVILEAIESSGPGIFGRCLRLIAACADPNAHRFASSAQFPAPGMRTDSRIDGHNVVVRRRCHGSKCTLRKFPTSKGVSATKDRLLHAAANAKCGSRGTRNCLAIARAPHSSVSNAIFCASITSPGTRLPCGTKHHPTRGRPSLSSSKTF